MPKLVWNPNRRAFELAGDASDGSMPPSPYLQQAQQQGPSLYTDEPGSLDLSTPDQMHKAMQQMREQHEVNKRIEGEKKRRAERDAPDKARAQLALAEALGQFKYTSGAQIRAGVHQEAPEPQYRALRSLPDAKSQAITQEESDFYKSQGINIQAGTPRSSVDRIMPSLASFATRSQFQAQGQKNALDRQEIGFYNATAKMAAGHENSRERQDIGQEYALERQAIGRENTKEFQATGQENFLDRQAQGFENSLDLQGIRSEDAMNRVEVNQGRQDSRAVVREDRLGRQFETTQGNKGQAEKQKIVDVYSKRPEVSASFKSRAMVDRIQELLNNPTPQNDQFVFNFLPRLGMEVGNLSISDRAIATQRFGWENKLNDWLSRGWDGKIGDAQRKELKQLTALLAKANDDVLDSVADEVSQSQALVYEGQVDAPEIRKLLRPNSARPTSTQAAPAQAPPPGPPGKIRVLDKKTGKPGWLSPQFFSPDKYERL